MAASSQLPAVQKPHSVREWSRGARGPHL